MIVRDHTSGETTSLAWFSDCTKYRYLLTRTWDINRASVLFIMLNPSTADEKKNDPTVKRCFDYAHRWGFGSMEVANLFAYRSTDPAQLMKVEDPIGPNNTDMITRSVKRVGMVIGAWGTNVPNPFYIKTAHLVMDVVTKYNHLYALSRTKEGMPSHPLYLKKDAIPFIYLPRRL